MFTAIIARRLRAVTVVVSIQFALVLIASLAFVDPARAAGITLQQTGAPFNNPIGVAYNPTNTSLIVTSNYSSGSPDSLMRIDQFGNTTPWSSASGYPGERYLDIPRAVNAPSGWTVGETFTGNGQVGQIARISANGATVTNNWVTLPGETGYPAGQLRFDNTGLFNNDLIVATTSGNVWRIKSNGTPVFLANLGTAADFEGLAVVPNNPTRYGPLAGQIIVGHEGSTTLWTVDTSGNVSSYPGILPAQCEGLHVIPANEHFVGVDYAGSRILWADQSEFTPFVGDIMVVSEIIGANPGNPSGLNRLLWTPSGSGGSFSFAGIGLNPTSLQPQLWEGSTFAPVVVPEPTTLGMIAAIALSATSRRRRGFCRLPL